MTRRAWVALLLGAVAFFAIINIPQPDPAQRDDLPPELIGEPDFYMRDALLVQHDAEGAVHYRLRASEVRHFEDAGHTELLQPRLTLYRRQEPPWHARAERGDLRGMMQRADEGEESVRLREDVELHRAANASPGIALTTQELRIYPERRYAETQEPVMIESRGARSSGVGLRAELDRGVMNLGTDSEERVRTVVQPQQARGDS